MLLIFYYIIKIIYEYENIIKQNRHYIINKKIHIK